MIIIQENNIRKFHHLKQLEQLKPELYYLIVNIYYNFFFFIKVY